MPWRGAGLEASAVAARADFSGRRGGSDLTHVSPHPFSIAILHRGGGLASGSGQVLSAGAKQWSWGDGRVGRGWPCGPWARGRIGVFREPMGAARKAFTVIGLAARIVSAIVSGDGADRERAG